MYLSKINISRETCDSRNYVCYPHKIHSLVEQSLSPRTQRPRALWRLDNTTPKQTLYIVSTETPKLDKLHHAIGDPSTPPATKNYEPFLSKLDIDQLWHYRITVNPVRQTITKEGKTIRKSHIGAEYQQQWLQERQCQLGVELLNTIIMETKTDKFHKTSKHLVTINKTTFEGTLKIKDPDKLRQIMTCGIGKARAYGCGLLTLTKPHT